VPQTSSIRSAISVEFRLVTDRHCRRRLIHDHGIHRTRVVRYLTGPSCFWHKVRLTISLKTGQVKVRHFLRYSFHSHFSSSVTATFNKILFTKGGFSEKVHKNRLPFGWGSAALPRPSSLGRQIPPAHSPSSSTH